MIVSEEMDKMEGKDLPALELELIPGGTLSLPKDFLGKWSVLYFYPKDDTPGCTKQACTYQENLQRFQALGINIYGVSLDSISSHQEFQEKFSLQFPLIADTQKELSKALGVYGDQQWQGKTFQGLSRDSFAINPEGKIQQVWRSVSPTTTVEETYEFIQKFQQ